MKKLIILSLLLAVLGVGCGQTNIVPFKCSIKPDKEYYVTPEYPIIEFSLKNIGNKQIIIEEGAREAMKITFHITRENDSNTFRVRLAINALYAEDKEKIVLPGETVVTSCDIRDLIKGKGGATGLKELKPGVYEIQASYYYNNRQVFSNTITVKVKDK